MQLKLQEIGKEMIQKTDKELITKDFTIKNKKDIIIFYPKYYSYVKTIGVIDYEYIS